VKRGVCIATAATAAGRHLLLQTLPIHLLICRQHPQIGGRLLIANDQDQSLWLANLLKQWEAVRSKLLHSCLVAGAQIFSVPLLASRTFAKLLGQSILLSQAGMFWFFFIQL
jgi:hypothetical protein